MPKTAAQRQIMLAPSIRSQDAVLIHHRRNKMLVKNLDAIACANDFFTESMYIITVTYIKFQSLVY